MIRAVLIILALGVFAGDTSAQIGRRFEIKVVDGKLVAQGYIGGEGSGDDGGGLLRPYTNAIHHHWQNDRTKGVAHSDLPGIDLLDAGELEGYDLRLTVLGGKKWVDPPDDPEVGTEIDWSPLDADETIYVRIGDQHASTSDMGTILLAPAIGPSGAVDVGIVYDIKGIPRDQVMVVEAVLSTNAPGVTPSDVIYLIFPPGRGALHRTALYTEAQLGTPVVCEGDSNRDGSVDVGDITHVLFRLGECE